jgi:hypothetical protein
MNVAQRALVTTGVTTACGLSIYPPWIGGFHRQDQSLISEAW